MLDERDLEWKIPIISIIIYILSALVIVVFLFFFPICGIPLALIVGLRAYYINFLVNKKKKLAMAQLYASMDAQRKQQCFLQKYEDPSSLLFNLFLPLDRLEDYRLILLKPDGVELYEFGGTNTAGKQKVYHIGNIESITINDLKIMRNIVFIFRNEEGKTEWLYVFSHMTKNFSQMEQLVKSYYPQLIKG